MKQHAPYLRIALIAPTKDSLALTQVSSITVIITVQVNLCVNSLTNKRRLNN